MVHKRTRQEMGLNTTVANNGQRMDVLYPDLYTHERLIKARPVNAKKMCRGWTPNSSHESSTQSALPWMGGPLSTQITRALQTHAATQRFNF